MIAIVILIIFNNINYVKGNPDTGVTNCTNLTTLGETYILSNDIHNDQITDACINIFASNITLNCQGYYVYSIKNYSGIYSNSTNSTIKNCNITMGSGGVNALAFGIYLEKSNYSLIINNSIFGDSYAGIYVKLSFNDTLINNTGISYFGILISSSLNNLLTNNTGISNSAVGISISSSLDGSPNSNILTSNTGISSTSWGIGIGTSNNILINNTGISSSSNGIALRFSSNNTLISNIGRSNSGSGIYLQLSLNNTLINNTGISNSSYGIDIDLNSNNSNFISNTGISNSSSGIYVYANLGNTLTNNTGISNTTFGVSGPGIYLFQTLNNNLTLNTGTSKMNSGISLSYSNNSILTLNNGTSNINDGILISFSPNNTLTSNTGTSNTSWGINIISSDNNTLTSNTGRSNTSSGICIALSKNNTLINSISNNNGYGLYILNSNWTIVSNLTAKNNSRYGVFLVSNSYFNTIKDSFIQLNNGSAFSLNNSVSSPRNNTFYNNYFNNSLQISNFSASSTNYFNITKTSGTNIVGGTYLGGNYWAAPNGTGFSQRCTLSTDGICDTTYNLDGVNYDYLPLTCIESWSCSAWSTCSEDIQTRTCIDSNLCQTYKYKPAESQFCNAGDSSAEVGGVTQTTTIASISPEEPAIIKIIDSRFGPRIITINVNKPIQTASLTITEVNVSLAQFQIGFQGLSYEAFEITTKNLSNEDIENATIEFRVNKTELSKHNLTIEDVFLYRKQVNETQWSPLNTTYLNNDSVYDYFFAVSPGFSTFLVFVSKEECIPAEKRCFENQVQFCLGNKRWLISEVCDYKCENGKCIEKGLQINLNPLIVYPIIGIIVIGVLISFLAQRIIKKRGGYMYSSVINKKFEER
jgi:PGF-pre-PGF domain-containing protein